MEKVLFIDRDGTIIIEPPEDYQVDSLEKLEFIPKAISNLRKIAEDLDYLLVMVTNQDGLGTASFPEETFWPAHNKMLKILEGEGIHFNDILIDKSLPEENKMTRKPGTGLLTEYMNGDYDLANSYVIGDRPSDILLAQNLGTKAIYYHHQHDERAILTTNDWDRIFQFLQMPPRTAQIQRNTKETKINININLDGSGKTDIQTGLGFFDHLLISSHGIQA